MRDRLFLVSGMTCAACAARIEAALRAVAGVETAAVDVMGHRARVVAAPAVSNGDLMDAVRREGYGLVALESRARGQSKHATLLDVSTAFSAIVAIMALASDFDFLPSPNPFLIPVVALIAASPLIVRGLREWVRLRPGMDALVTLSALAALGTLGMGPSDHHMHESANTVAHLLAAVMVGKWLEEQARRRALSSFEELVHSLPEEATLHDGRRVLASTLVLGDQIVVGAGERFPTNGTALADAIVNESLLSGEALPVRKAAGSQVFGGTLNLELPVRVSVASISAESRAAVMIRAMEHARSSKSSLGRWSERVLRVFVPVLIVLAVMAGLWHARDGDWTNGVRVLAATLAVACPCALGLAVPAALSASLGALARAGIVVRDAEALEIAADIDFIAFDKTGTLTERNLGVTLFQPLADDSGDALRLAAAACVGSRHPASIAIVRAALAEGHQIPDASGFIPMRQGGVAARVNGHVVAVGQRSWHVAHGISVTADAEVESEVIIAVDGVARVRVVLGESLRPGTHEAISLLKSRGYGLSILSGDRSDPVKSIGDTLGISDARGGLSPEAKADHIRYLHRAGRRVAMVGDGLNDGLALAASDLRVCVGEDADLVSTGAHVIVSDGSPRKLATLMNTAARTRAIMRQNLVMSVVYNLAMTPIAMSGALSPSLCAVAMAASSLLVVGNALRLVR